MARQADAVRRRKILDMVKTQGQVDVSDLVIELNSSTTQVREDIESGTHRLVGELFFDLKIMDKYQIEEVVKEIILSTE